jgi:hypothetical protein
LGLTNNRREGEALKASNLQNFGHKKRRPWTSLDVYLVPGGFEPGSTPIHCWSISDKTSNFAPFKAAILGIAGLLWLVISTLFRHAV